ncbi:hypothetical protein RHGRI_022200 [Rhododendron griersonianum]|uniref:Uncharacterized protein n=1 Tax=Rhododendron griersonianum TaxID=479676 RepID=A0AAV6JN72_9ERIC|nr:hypothetical protein RHGRI_022200 [Rhododendron griersonianum]
MIKVQFLMSKTQIDTPYVSETGPNLDRQTKDTRRLIFIQTQSFIEPKVILEQGQVEKQSKTKMDTEVDEPLPMPERKEYKIYLDRKHEDGLPSAGKRYLESEEACCASEMIEPSFGVTGIFFALLTEEELKQLGGMDGVKIFEEKNYRCEYF